MENNGWVVDAMFHNTVNSVATCDSNTFYGWNPNTDMAKAVTMFRGSGGAKLVVGNCWSSAIEIEVGRSGESASSRIPLLKKATLNLMTRIDCRNGANAEAMKFLNKDDLNPKVLESRWDRLAILCKQADKNDVLFGISTLGTFQNHID